MIRSFSGVTARIAVTLSLVLFFACASARMSDRESDRLFREGRYDDAAAHLKKGIESEGENGRDLLLFLLDEGLALHSAGRFEESNQYFLKADKIAEIKDYTSLSTETATLLVSENITDYKGEDFEKVLIHVYLAMNYSLMGNVDDALVEARRVNRMLYQMVNEGKRKYKQNAFARYLSAILYESQGNWNDAYVDYKNTYDLMPNLPGLGIDLWRVAKLNEMNDDAAEWDQKFGLTAADHQAAQLQMPKSGKGEIIVLYENGISPIKRPNPAYTSVPKFFPRYNPVYVGSVEINGQVVTNTHLLEDIQATAIENLDEKYAGIIAKKIGGMVAKGAVGYGVSELTKSPLLGALVGYGLMKADSADLRSWNLLPRDLQIARITAEPGTYNVRVLPNGGYPTPMKTIQVAKGSKVFVDFRFMP